MNRRTRLVALAAGLITVLAIVLALASGYLGLTWLWLRPAAELLLLAELVGLIVLERHQLFEPVHEKVGRIDATLSMLNERLAASGQVEICSGPAEVLSTQTRTIREALSRNHETPQILRCAALSGKTLFGERWQLAHEREELLVALSAYFAFPTTPPSAPARRWLVRVLGVFAERENYDRFWEMGSPILRENPLNIELKFAARSSVQAVLSPQIITDRDVVIALDDQTAVFRWGVHFQGRQYVALFAQWFDELWANLPGAHLIYSRNGLDQRALDQFKRELAAQDLSAPALTSEADPLLPERARPAGLRD